MPGKRLCLEERETLGLGLAAGLSLRAIGRKLGRPPSTLSRERKRNSGQDEYRASQAERASIHRARRPKPRKLALNETLACRVAEDLGKRWSPQQISRRLRHDFPNEPCLWVSHETIYQSLYVQGRGGLRKELTQALRSGRARRRPQGVERRPSGRIQHMVNISERPPEVEDRAVPGHWEGDLIVGKNGKSQVATLVERTTRYVMLIRVTDRSASTVRTAIANRIRSLPRELKLSLTWDQGKELAEHQLLHLASRMDIYFCDPHSPWQRGSNENTNGLLRQYLPKGTDLSVHSTRSLNKIARELNGRPRETLGWMTPAEKFAQLLQ